MAADVKVLIKALLDDKQFRAGVKKMATDMGTTQKKSSGFFRSMKTGFLAIGAAVVGLGIILVKTFKVVAQFEQSIAKVVSITGEGRKALERMARTAGKTTVFSAKEAADALFFLASAGISVKDMAEVLEPALNLASAGQLGIAEATDAVVNSLKVFSADMSEAADFTDIMATASKNANTDMAQLVEALRTAGPIAATAGIEFKDLNVLIAAMADRGIKGSRAGIQLRQAFARLIKPTEQAKQALAKYGITTEEITRLLPTPIALFKRLNDAGLSNADALAVLGVRQSGVFSLIKDGIPTLEKLEGKMEDYTGTSKEMANVQVKTVIGSIKLLKSAWQELILVISGDALPGLRNTINMFRDIIRTIAKNADETKKYGKTLSDNDKALIKNGESSQFFWASVRDANKQLREQITITDNLRKKEAELREERGKLGLLGRFKKEGRELTAEINKLSNEIDRREEKTISLLEKLGFDTIKTGEQFKKAFDGIQNEITETANLTEETNTKILESDKEKTARLAAQAQERAELLKEIDDIHKESIEVSEEEELQKRLDRINILLEKVREGSEEEIMLNESKNATLAEQDKILADKKKKADDAEIKSKQKKAAIIVAAEKAALNDITSLSANSNKTLFAIGKSASLAQAIINNAQAITRTMAEVPFPFNIPLAAGQAAAGAVQIANISAQELPAFQQGTDFFGGGRAIVGEGGPEIVNLPFGSGVVPNRDLPGAGGGAVTNNVSNETQNIDNTQNTINVDSPTDLLESINELEQSHGFKILQRNT